jgi:hypothetical protein
MLLGWLACVLVGRLFTRAWSVLRTSSLPPARTNKGQCNLARTLARTPAHTRAPCRSKRFASQSPGSTEGFADLCPISQRRRRTHIDGTSQTYLVGGATVHEGRLASPPSCGPSRAVSRLHFGRAPPRAVRASVRRGVLRQPR